MLRELGTIEYAYTLTPRSTMEEKFAYYQLVNRYIDDRLNSMGVRPGGIRLDCLGVRDGKLVYLISERRV